MSDPAKTPEEIEDVLASIRRLVSDHTPGPDGSMRPAEPAAPEPMRERLVLTQSHRVQEPDDPWSPVAGGDARTSGAEEEDISADEPDLTDSLVLDVLAREEAADAAEEVKETGEAGADDTETSESSEWQPDDRLAEYDTVGADEMVDFLADTDEEEAEPEPETSEVETSDDDMHDADIQADSDFESETGDDNWPGEGAEAALLTLVARREPVSQPVEADIADETGDESEAEDMTAEVEAAVDAALADATPLAAEEFEAVGMADDEPEPDEVSEAEAFTEEPPVTPIFSRPKRPSAAVSEPDESESFEAEDLGEDPSPFTFPDSEEGVLDEETLREIIVDVVREELQGVLGQRITRNVRKMVRREIRLALAAEDLD